MSKPAFGMPLLAIWCLSVIFEPLSAQEIEPDSTRQLEEVVVRAFAQDRPITETPVAIGFRTSEDFAYFGRNPLLSTANTVPGVRMEERSQGSYRFSIRGSLLRSPFGVRNVKIYWNGLPLTDGGGNTYLNLLDASGVGTIEIIKGPGASLYGAGTGGVLLINNNPLERNGKVFGQAGSYGQLRIGANGGSSNNHRALSGSVSLERSDGYRQQSMMRRINAGATYKTVTATRDELRIYLLFASLFYETPGGLTLMQYQQNPRQARQPSATQPGAVEQQASVLNNSIFAGADYVHHWNDNWQTQMGALVAVNGFENPSIRNMETRDEKNIGVRLEDRHVWSGDNIQGKFVWGGEFQVAPSSIDVFDNNQGNKGSPQTGDDVIATIGLTFAQLELDLPYDFNLTVGSSLNFLTYQVVRTFPAEVKQTRKFDPELSPRIALLKKISPDLAVYANVSNGFSPPGIAEVRPSTNTFNPELDPEKGVSFEAGVKGKLLRNRLYYEMAAYRFQLKETIVIQRASDGAEYFVNAGATDQKGIEAYAAWQPTTRTDVKLRLNKLWVSYTYQHYRFEEYVNDGIDFSGNELTGVPPVVVTSGLSVEIGKRLEWIVTLNFTGHIALNDANTAYASSYLLLGSRLNFHLPIGKNQMEIYAGIDNALDESYSLGNDLNAFGGRYYNPAAPRNYSFGVHLTF